ncbi:fibronectin type III domain-containing protein [Parapedobacter tibetensis]|uniref:fibronectin type III domain-containing protein n=1 Tax=Parapedobacter tibetensis TaxID=2972951 RepID=UPI00214DABD3|nr:fibronectin type III domain-containing protein [Parapedobacter tibetensis]
MYYKPKFSFKRKSSETLDHAAEKVFTNMGGNSLFADLAEEVAGLGTELADYREVVAEAIRGGKRDTAVRNQVRGILEGRLQLLAMGVQRVAKGDPTIILAAGFDHTKPRQPKGTCPQPTDVRAINGSLGSRRITLKVAPERTARSYRFAYRKLDSGNPWIEVDSHGSSRILEGLEQFAVYEFRCTYIGNNPDVLNYSDSVTATVI